jgi:cbb3-type cytochrome oxidase subunit 1
VKGLAFGFFLMAALSVTAGMVWGIHMAASHDHTMAPAHAHLNLVGWVTLALFGVYYHLTPQAAAGKLARVHFALAVAGVALMVPGIALAQIEAGEGLAVAGSVLTFGSMAVFLYTVFRHGLGAPAA